MSIVSSVIVADNVQVDGRRWIDELHTDNLGLTYGQHYLADAGFDANAALAVHATKLTNDINDAEIERNVTDVETNGSLAKPVLIYTKASDNFAALRNAYKVAVQHQAVMIGDYLNTLTNAQLMAAFNLTLAQANNLRTNKLQPAANTAAEIRASTGT